MTLKTTHSDSLVTRFEILDNGILVVSDFPGRWEPTNRRSFVRRNLLLEQSTLSRETFDLSGRDLRNTSRITRDPKTELKSLPPNRVHIQVDNIMSLRVNVSAFVQFSKKERDIVRPSFDRRVETISRNVDSVNPQVQRRYNHRTEGDLVLKFQKTVLEGPIRPFHTPETGSFYQNLCNFLCILLLFPSFILILC